MKNPKTKAGLAALAVLLVLGFILAVVMIPEIRETRREMSLTPTPLPPVPDSVMAVTRDPNAPTPEPVLRTGSQGQEVTDLQSRLQALGYYEGGIDGQFGAGTKEAVLLFQKQNGLIADGIVGSETRTLLFSPQAKPCVKETTETEDAVP